jgi:hypothetical protein
MATSAPRKDHSLLNRPSIDNRRYSELPYQLDMGFSAETLPLDLDYSALANRVYYSSPDLNFSGQTGVLGRSHLHGTSSGSGRSAILSIDDSSCTNSACTAPTSPVNSDGMSSVYDCTAFDFPEPPPFASPIIRRMRSSPWFLNHVHDWREKVQPATLDDLSSRLRPSLSQLSTNKKSNFQADYKLPSTPTNAEHLLAKRDSHRFNANDRGLGICGASTSTLRFGASPLKTTDSFLRDEKVTSRRDHPPLGRLPRIIRKVASMRSEPQKANEPGHGHARRSVPKIRSFRSILRAAEESTAPKTNMRRESWNQGKPYPSWTREQSFATRGTEVEKVALTSKSMVAVGENKLLDAAPSSRSLYPSLSHGVNWKSDFNTSFIDISPDRGPSKHKGKEKMKSLLSRANEIFSWRRLRRK